VERHKAEVREARRPAPAPDLWLDLRLALRMLVRRPGLTLVGAFAIAMATTIGAASFEEITEVLRDDVPLAEGERLVSLQYATGNQGNPERRVLHDFVAWREELRQLALGVGVGALLSAGLSAAAGADPARAAALLAAVAHAPGGPCGSPASDGRPPNAMT
jgi:hypothetical protein